MLRKGSGRTWDILGPPLEKRAVMIKILILYREVLVQGIFFYHARVPKTNFPTNHPANIERIFWSG